MIPVHPTVSGFALELKGLFTGEFSRAKTGTAATIPGPAERPPGIGSQPVPALLNHDFREG
jgi:hypothetical protein